MSKSGKVLTNIFWRFLERVGAQGVSFVVSIILARLLAPEVYGLIALVTVFTTILNVFVDSGFGNALIQKKNADDVDFSTVFFFNITMCAALYLLVFLAAPWISAFYDNSDLTPVIRVLSLTIIISGVKNVQQAYVSRTMQFKRFFFATLGGTLGAAVVGITMACYGFGVWALVAQQIFNATVDTVILWITVKWRPKKVFSFARLKGLFAFGWKLLVSSMLETVYSEVRQLIIGKIYTSADLAQYNRGRQFPYFFITNINTAIDSVLLPAMSSEQDDRSRIKMMTRRSITISTYLLAPIMVGLIAIAEPLVELVLTAKWMPSVPFMRIFCMTFIFYPIHTANLNAIKAMGKSDLFLKLEVIKKVVGIIALLVTMWISVEALAWSLFAVSIIGQIINSWPNRKLLNYSYTEQIKDIFPAVALSVFMGGCVYLISFLHASNIIVLSLQIAVGACIYVLGSIVFKLESFKYIISTLKQIKSKG